MSADRVNDLLLLLSMSGLAAGCSKGVANDGAVPFGPGPGSSADTDEDDEEETSDGEETESGTDGGSESDPILTSGPATTSGDSITVDPTDATTSGTPETTTGITTDPASSSGIGEDSSSSGPVSASDTSQTGDGCTDYAVWAEDCYGYTDGYEWCEYQVAYGTAYYGAACGAAVEELFACISTQPCGGVNCPAEDAAVQAAC